MKHVLSILTQREMKIEAEIERIKSLTNKNKHIFIKTQEEWLVEVLEAKKILIEHMNKN